MTWGFIILLVFAVLLYGVMAMNVVSMRSSDAAGNGMAMAFAAIFGLAFWIVMLVMLLDSERSFLFSFAVVLALAVALVVSIVDAALGRRRYPTILLPLPFLAFAIWARVA